MSRRISTVFAGILLAAPMARAQSGAEVEATWRALVAQAVTAQTAGDHTRALDLAQRAVQTHATPSLLRFVAQEQIALRQFVPALASAQTCVDRATENRAVPERAATLAACRALVHEAEAQVGHVVLEAPDAPPGLTVTVGGAAVPPSLLGVPFVVAPGSVVVEASAPGRTTFRTTVDVAASRTVPVHVALAARAPTVTPTVVAVTPPPVPVVPPVLRTPLPLPNPPPPPSTTLRTIAWTSAGLGAAGLLAGALFTGLRERAVSSFNDAGCVEQSGVATPRGSCPSDQSTANGLQPAVIASWVVGGVFGAASVALFIAAPSRRPERAAMSCGPMSNAPGVLCGGRF